jgi:hypothetical protein
VKDEDSSLLVTQNVHTDIPEHIHELFHLPGFYLDAIADWQYILDVISFDAYPNYVVATPLYGDVLGNRTAAILQVLQNNSSQILQKYKSLQYPVRSSPSDIQPVMVMETGYPVAADPSEQPSIVNYTAEAQAQYMQQALQSVVANGARGFQVFGLWPCPGFSPPPGGYTREDVRALTSLNEVYQSGDLLPALTWLLLPPGTPLEHLEYAVTRLPEVVGVVENGWGILNPDGTPKPAYTTLQQLYSQL